ncbi:MAG: DUF481 domain-containing protein [Nitrospiria bacterium]
MDYFYDSQQNLLYRVILGGSAGYDLFRAPKKTLEFTVGPAFQRNQYESVAVDSPNPKDSLVWVLTGLFEKDLNNRIDFTLQCRRQMTRRDQRSSMRETITGVKYKILKRLSLNFSLTWDHTA